MKFQLSTALLLFGIVAVCVGWAVDRHNWSARLASLESDRAIRDERIFVGASISSSAGRACDILEEFTDIAGMQEYIQTQLILDFLEIFHVERQLLHLKFGVKNFACGTTASS